MAESRMTEIATELLRLSEVKKLKWENSIRKNEFRVVFPDMSFRITMEDSGKFRLHLVGDTGQAIDTLESSDSDVLIEGMGDLADESAKPSQEHKQLKAIFKLADSYVKEEGIRKALTVLRQT